MGQKKKVSGHEQVENENERRSDTMATCCGIIVFTVWELIAIVAGLIALATNAWIVPGNTGTACLLGVQGAGLWTVCTGKGAVVENCQEVLSSNVASSSNATETGENILSQLESTGEQIQRPSSWIFTSNDECTPISDQAAVKAYYSALPVGATDSKDYWLYIQS